METQSLGVDGEYLATWTKTVRAASFATGMDTAEYLATPTETAT